MHAGYDGSARYLLNTNLLGTVNCLDYARRHGSAMIFLSTSRVYSIAALRGLPLRRDGDRLVVAPGESGDGWSERGIAEDFPTTGARSLYGASKLASELLIEEYNAAYGLRTIVNRCGVLTGPWQMGKVDQGFFVLWAARHLYGGALAYSGFGGAGHQVRDVLHVADLHDLICRQIDAFDRHCGRTYNIGGGTAISVSLAELTALCAARTGNRLPLGSEPATRPADIPYYVTDTDRGAPGDRLGSDPFGRERSSTKFWNGSLATAPSWNRCWVRSRVAGGKHERGAGNGVGRVDRRRVGAFFCRGRL